ncbi:MAG: thiamine phosphate synthase, partial [Clostridia bacterium]|nr:thiamine phosphate synthase [Clostridia bacterium]
VVQLREKVATSREFYLIAQKVKMVTDKYNISLIINDRLDIALAVDAAGLHVGQRDLPAHIARRILGSDKILGVSAVTLTDAQRAENEGADYLGVGAVFPTDSKNDADTVTLDMLTKIKNSVKIPVVGIGGINKDNILEVMKTGADGASVISAIFGKENIKEAASVLNNLICKEKQ